eukprot:239715-Karenia_brevis.AAC.1
MGTKVILDVFQQSTLRTLLQKIHNIIAEEGLMISATQNMSVGNKNVRRLPALMKGIWWQICEEEGADPEQLKIKMSQGIQNPEWQVSWLQNGKHHVLAKIELTMVSPECQTHYILMTAAESIEIEGE